MVLRTTQNLAMAITVNHSMSSPLKKKKEQNGWHDEPELIKWVSYVFVFFWSDRDVCFFFLSW